MKFSRKLPIAIMLVVLTIVSCLPATFSWYSHSKESNGTRMNLSEDDLPVSLKSAQNCVSFVTDITDEKGEVTSDDPDDHVTSISVTPAEKVKYYKTTFQNDGTNDVMVDLEVLNMPNDADFCIGTLSPTLNEKAHASRAVRNKVSDNTVRVYFTTNNGFNPYWTHYTGDNAAVSFDKNMTNDFNIAYKVSGASSETNAKLSRCPNTGSSNDNTNVNDTWVFYFDVPSNAEYFYFFNHWYFASTTNREWNRTQDITDLSAGRLYHLNGDAVDGLWKDYNVSSVDTDLVAVNQYYSSVRMSHGAGVFTDITLHKTGDDENFVPEYYGKSIAYRSSNTSIASVNKDGIITPGSSYGTTTITTTITGKYGDFRTVQTTVEIPQNIAQVPIIKNVRVPAGDKVDIYWYALNNSTTATMETDNFLFTT